jgi:outer membrane lipoprotein SlyB
MKIHPLIAGAAASVMVMSGVGVAAITGYLPGSNAAKAPEQKAAAKPCAECGVVLRVKEVEVKGKGTGLGAVAGGIAGAVVGHEISDGRDAGTLVGAAGGAIAGHQIERHARTTKRYQTEVRMTDGTVKTVSSAAQPTWKNGDRVRLQNGKLISEEGATRAKT